MSYPSFGGVGFEVKGWRVIEEHSEEKDNSLRWIYTKAYVTNDNEQIGGPD